MKVSYTYLSIGAVVLFASSVSVDAFAPSLFQAPKTAPSKTPEGVEIELPDFDELFGRIKKVSPLARQVMEGQEGNRGFQYVDDTSDEKWKVIESRKTNTVHRIDKIDNYMKLGPPLLRFRASLKGPCLGDPFADFIMTLDERERWDDQIAAVDELYPIDAAEASKIIGDGEKFGSCYRLGVGYCQTKAAFGISPREQLTICGVNDFEDGSVVIWGTEMEEDHDHLLPDGKRHTRAKSHIFCTTLTPTGEDTFDVEYILQMETGGLPAWITTPVMVDTVKSLMKHAEAFYAGGEGSELETYLSEKAELDRQIVEKAAERDQLLVLQAADQKASAVEGEAETVETHSMAMVKDDEVVVKKSPTTLVVPEHEHHDLMTDEEHDRLVQNHRMVLVHDDKPKSMVRRVVSKAASKAAAAKSMWRTVVDSVAEKVVTLDDL